MYKEAKLCCTKFEECVKRGEIAHSDEFDETEWYVPNWYHLYYCPFCGKFIKGKGYGEVFSGIEEKK